MDPWYSLGSGDMLEVAHMGLHVGQMTSREAMRFCFDAVTVNPAKAMGLEGYGLDVGCNADMVLLQAADPIEAIRLRGGAVTRSCWHVGDCGHGGGGTDTPARTGDLLIHNQAL